MKMIITITCPKCGSKISYKKGEPPLNCVSCQVLFQDPNSIPLPSPNATVVKVEPVNLSTGGGN